MSSTKNEDDLVAEIMTKEVIHLDSSKTVEDAAKIMKKFQVGSVVIIENLIAVGIVTERDLVRRVIAENKSTSTKLKDVMSSPLVVISPDESISELAKLMIDRKIHKVPVISQTKVNQSHLAGIVTTTDLIRFSRKESISKMNQLISQVCLRK